MLLKGTPCVITWSNVDSDMLNSRKCKFHVKKVHGNLPIIRKEDPRRETSQRGESIQKQEPTDIVRLGYLLVAMINRSWQIVHENARITHSCLNNTVTILQTTFKLIFIEIIVLIGLCPHYTCSRSCPDLGFCPDRKITAIERDKCKLILTWSC